MHTQSLPAGSAFDPALSIGQTYEGDVIITKDKKSHWKSALRNTTRIYGSLTIMTNMIVDKIEFVSGSVDIDHHIAAKLPDLLYIGDDCFLHGEEKVEMNNLKAIGGTFYVHGPTSVSNLEYISRNLFLKWGMKAPKLAAVGGDIRIGTGYKLMISGIPCVGGGLYISDHVWDLKMAILERRIYLLGDF